MIVTQLSIVPPDGLDPRRARDVADQEITRGLDEIATEFERRVKNNAPVGVGGEAGLRGSVFREVRGVPAREAFVGTTMPHAPIVELGRRPGQARPPIARIERWVERKLGVPADQARSVAFRVASKIAKRGSKGAFMFQRTLDEGRAVLDTVWSRVGERIVRCLGGPPIGE